MAITRPKKTKEDAEDAFITAAPDADAKPKGVMKGNRRQISLTIAPALLEKIDDLASELGQTRAALINMAIYRAVEHGLLKE
jgi:hypothetical protein